MTTERESGPPLPTPPTVPQVGSLQVAGNVAAAPPEIRSFLGSRGSGKAADNSFAALMLLCACSIFVIVLFILSILILRSHLSRAEFGWKFFIGQNWDPVAGDFGALPFIYGTL